MISEYKLYHGAVFMEIICRHGGKLLVRGYGDEGRTASYVIDEKAAIHIKHSASRLRPWQFTFTPEGLNALTDLRRSFDNVFVILVCWTDGIVCLSLDEVQSIFSREVGTPWLRIDRRKYSHYGVHGPAGELSTKKPSGIDPLLRCLT